MNIDSNKILVDQILNICFPIGKIEIFYDNLDHSNYMGFTWERCLYQRSPIGYQEGISNYNTIGKQFGEKEHTLTINEMPKHRHSLRVVRDAINTDSQGDLPKANNGQGNNSGWTDYYYAASGADMAISCEGEDQPHNNIHPVEVVAFWRRIS